MTIVEQVPAYAWKQWVENNRGFILDVREPDEWVLGTLPNSERISLAVLPHRLHTLDRDKPVLVVCRSGNRSNQAAALLSMAGFKKVANLSGGLAALGMTV